MFSCFFDYLSIGYYKLFLPRAFLSILSIFKSSMMPVPQLSIDFNWLPISNQVKSSCNLKAQSTLTNMSPATVEKLLAFPSCPSTVVYPKLLIANCFLTVSQFFPNNRERNIFFNVLCPHQPASVSQEFDLRSPLFQLVPAFYSIWLTYLQKITKKLLQSLNFHHYLIILFT